MLKEKENFIVDLKTYIIPENLQTFDHIDNLDDINDLSQSDNLCKIVTNKGFQDLGSNNFMDYENNSNSNHMSTHIQIMTRQLFFHLPPFLTPQIWKFYRMSLEHIYEMFQAYTPLPLWCLCLLFQLNICTFAIKASYANSVSLIRDSKAPAKKTLHEFLSDPHINQKLIHNKSFNESIFLDDLHKPRLTVYTTDCTTLNLLLDILPSKQIFDSVPLRYPIPYEKCFHIRGKKYIPYLVHEVKQKKYLLLVRIVSAFTYFVTYDVPSCISFDPLYILLKDEKQNNQLFCSVDDAIYITDIQVPFITPTLSSRKRKQHTRGKKNQKNIKI